MWGYVGIVDKRQWQTKETGKGKEERECLPASLVALAIARVGITTVAVSIVFKAITNVSIAAETIT